MSTFRGEVQLDAEKPNLMPKSLSGQAATYFENQWEALNRYCESGIITIDRADAEAGCDWAKELVICGQQAGRSTCSDFVQSGADVQAIGSRALGFFEGSLWSIANAGRINVYGGT